MAIKVYNRISKIKGLWEQLFSKNPTLTYFQSYEWNQCLENRFKSLHFIKYRNCKIRYIVCNDELIAPLVINEAEHHINMVGHDESSDYLTFIHGPMSVECLKKDIKEVLITYRNYHFQLSKINEIFPMREAMEKLISDEIKCIETHSAACVHVFTDYDTSLYNNMGKSKRQNYRTALNRMEKDGHKYIIETGFKKVDKKLSQKLYKLYFQRRYDCDEQPSGRLKQLYYRVRYRIGISSFGDRQDVLSNYAKRKPVFLSSIFIDGNLAAFCEGAYSNDGKIICIARVATHSDYYKYSPGFVLLVNTIDKVKDQIRVFDLTRGTESYKFDLNGVKHLNYSYQIET